MVALNGRNSRTMMIEYEPIPAGMEVGELYIGEAVCLVRRARRREGRVEGIQFALAPFARTVH